MNLQIISINRDTNIRRKNWQKAGADTIETFCRIYCEEAEAEDIRAEVAFTQAMKETGFLQFGGDVSIEQFNFCRNRNNRGRSAGKFLSGCQNRSAGTDPASEGLCDR